MDLNNGELIRVMREGQDDDGLEPLNLGVRVRELRKAREWTLEQAAKEAGLARSTLSKIENGQMSPTFDAVKKLADGLGISVPQLFTPSDENAGKGRRVIQKTDDAQVTVTSTYEHELLCSELSRKRMLPYRARIRARKFEDFDGWIRHEGEEFLYILSGVVRFYTEFYEPAELRRGDSAYYDATMGHNLISVSDEDAQVLWVTSLA